MSQTTTSVAERLGPATAAGPSKRLVGLLAEYESPEALLSAAEKVRDAGFRRWDTHTPFPVHGIDRAMGVRPTSLPWLIFFLGATGTGCALLMQCWMNAFDYPFIVSGKPFYSIPAFIPITFELTVLFASLTAVFGMLGFNGLPRLYNPLLGSDRFRRASDDRFFIHIQADDPKFNEASARRLLESTGCAALEGIEEDTAPARLPKWMFHVGVVFTILAFIPPLMAIRAWVTKSDEPRIHVVFDMDNQEKFKAQRASAIFADGRAARLPVGATPENPLGLTVARGELREDDHFYRGRMGGQFANVFPPEVPLSEDLMQRGRNRFEIYCAPCHGVLGDGNGLVALRVKYREIPWVAPKSLHDDTVRPQPVGQLFQTITYGIRTMPPYGDQIPERDRWAIVAYIRALQRSQTVTPQNVSPAQWTEIKAKLERK